MTALVMLLFSGCKQRLEESSPPQLPAHRALTEEAQTLIPEDEHSPVAMRLPVLDEHVFRLAGPIDFANRYLPAVQVMAQLDSANHGCSGVIIHPQLVLTAGHCVCSRKPVTHQGTGTIIDSSSCAPSATVTTIHYIPPNDTDSNRRRGNGKVIPHPDLRVALDPHGELLSSTADLALIVLDVPLGQDFPPVSLAKAEAQVNDIVTIVGYGYDEAIDGYSGDRRFSKSRVTRLAASGKGTTLVDHPDHHLYRLDSGGPCLRVGPNDLTLVGVSSRDLGEGAAFTSIFPYREWLRSQIQRINEHP